MKTLRGIPIGIETPIMGRVTRRARRFGRSRDTILVAKEVPRNVSGHAAIIAAGLALGHVPFPCVGRLAEKDLGGLVEGDVLLMSPDGSITRLWAAGSNSNVIMVTNSCNCRCLMCPQPSGPDEPDKLAWNLRLLHLVSPETVTDIALTGGEPTVRLDDLCMILELCRDRLPHAPVSLLTNGRRLHDFEVARRIALIQHPRLTYCVSLGADVASLHDEIMGAQGSFADAVEGLHNLARLRQRVEIRVVLLKQNYRRLPALAEFVFSNFRFVSHVALMGMETTGLAWQNIDRVWIDPVEYVPQLRDAVRALHQRDLRVSVYNLPLCVLARELWRFARDSISDWKKCYLAECQGCDVRTDCPGLFSTSMRQSRGIVPVRDAGVPPGKGI